MFKVILSCLLLMSALQIKADTLPKNVNILIPYGPGGIADVQVRHLSQWLDRKGIKLTSVYKPGGNSSIAAAELISAAKDGSVLMINSTSNSWLAEQRIGKKIIEPVITTGGTAQAMITYPGSKYENVDNFLRDLRSGDIEIKIGWHSVATLLNLHQLIAKTNSPKPIFVPYKTSTDSSRDVSGKHIPLAQVPMSTAIPLVEAGKVKIVYAFSANASGLPADVVNLQTKIKTWRHDELFFIGLPPHTDRSILDQWYRILHEYLQDKETDEVYKKAYFGKEIGNSTLVNATIKSQSEAIIKYQVDIK